MHRHLIASFISNVDQLRLFPDQYENKHSKGLIAYSTSKSFVIRCMSNAFVMVGEASVRCIFAHLEGAGLEGGQHTVKLPPSKGRSVCL